MDILVVEDVVIMVELIKVNILKIVYVLNY